MRLVHLQLVLCLTAFPISLEAFLLPSGVIPINKERHILSKEKFATTKRSLTVDSRPIQNSTPRQEQHDAVSSSSTSSQKQREVEKSLFGLLIGAVFQALSRPFLVSLPGGVLLLLVALPFVVSLPEAMLTVTLFSGFSHVARKMTTSEASSPRTTEDKVLPTKPSPVWDTVSLGLAAQLSHHHTAAVAAHTQHHGLHLPGPFFLVIGLVGSALVVVSRTSSSDNTDTTSSSQQFDSLEVWDSLYDKQEVQSLNKWDMEMVERESTTTDTESSANAVVFTRHLTPGQKDWVRRDCYVPAGAIGIFMISTKNGPVIHSVKDDGSLTDHVASGDRIIALDGMDTRSCSAEEVMQMMMTRRNQRRKLTVLSQISNTS